jgi:hypothetical protein
MMCSPASVPGPGDIVAWMNIEALTSNWALIFAAVPALIAVILVLRFVLGRTASGQLRKMLKDHRVAQKRLAKARKLSQKTIARVEKLASREGQTKPRILQEAREAAEDARSLEKIADDQMQITANHVRRVIHEEFPPVRQEKLSKKYLPQD